MDEKDWTCLATIFDEKSLTNAAGKLYISQPALTYRIRELEKELGIKIFERGKGAATFTSEGQTLVMYSKKMLVARDKLKSELQKINQSENSVLNISAGDIVSHTELPDILTSFYQLHPNIKIKILSINPNNILASLMNAESHITIIRSNLDWSDSRLILRRDSVCLISKRPITFAMLPKLPFISLYLTTASKNMISEWWQEYFSVPPLIEMSVTRPETSIEMVKQDLGYMIYPLSNAQIKQLKGELCITPLYHKNNTPLELILFAYYRKETRKIKIVKLFIKFLEQYFRM